MTAWIVIACSVGLSLILFAYGLGYQAGVTRTGKVWRTLVDNWERLHQKQLSDNVILVSQVRRLLDYIRSTRPVRGRQDEADWWKN